MSEKVCELPEGNREVQYVSTVELVPLVDKVNDCEVSESKPDAVETETIPKSEIVQPEPEPEPEVALEPAEAILDSTTEPEPTPIKSEEPEVVRKCKELCESEGITKTLTLPYLLPVYKTNARDIFATPDETIELGTLKMKIVNRSPNTIEPDKIRILFGIDNYTEKVDLYIERRDDVFSVRKEKNGLVLDRYGEKSVIKSIYDFQHTGDTIPKKYRQDTAEIEATLETYIIREANDFLKENSATFISNRAIAKEYDEYKRANAPTASEPEAPTPAPEETTAPKKNNDIELFDIIATSTIPSCIITVPISIDGQTVPQDFMFATHSTDKTGKPQHRMNIDYTFADIEGNKRMFSNGSYFINDNGLYPLKLQCGVDGLLNGEVFVASVESLASARFGEVTDECKAKAKTAIIEAASTAYGKFMTINIQELITTHQLIEKYKSGTDTSKRDTNEKYFSINGLRYMIPFPYVNKSNNLYHRKIKMEKIDGEEVEGDPIDTYICNGVAITGRGKFPDGRDCYAISVHVGLGKWIEHNIDAWRLRNRIELKKVVAECGIKLSEKYRSYDMFMEFLDSIEEAESIAEYEGDSGFRIPTFESTKQAGWNEDCTAFVNVDKTISLTGKNIRLFRDDKPNQKRQYVHASGSKEEWARGTRGMHECKVTRFKCYGHISAPLLKPIGLSSYTLNNGGKAGKGKSIGASLSRSLSGDPEGLHFGGYATINSLEDYYKDMNHLATDGDELASKNRKMNEVADIIFMVSGEEGKGRKTEERTKHATVYITSIEKDIFTKSSNDGEFRRAIDVRDTITLSKDAIKAYVDIVLKNKNYGHILEPFILKVMEMHQSGQLMTLYDACLMHFPLSENGVKGTIYRYLALIATAGIIYEGILKELGLTTETLGENGIRSLTDKEVLELVSEIGESYIERIPEAIYMRALRAIWDVFYGRKQMYLNYPEVQSGEFGESAPNARVIEGHDTKTELLITRSALDEFLVSNGYPPEQCLLDFKENKFIKVSKSKGAGYTQYRPAFKGRFVTFDKIKIYNKVVGGIFDETEAPFDAPNYEAKPEPPKSFTFPISKKIESKTATEAKSPESELEATQLQVIRELDEGLTTMTQTTKYSELKSA